MGTNLTLLSNLNHIQPKSWLHILGVSDEGKKASFAFDKPLKEFRGGMLDQSKISFQFSFAFLTNF